ncbi:hypothetical protein BV360_05387 [Pseudomonas syringae pv. actinidiae]|nr:hypothetical protein BV340_05307 [Pseudomonas syringae pv. actinidiae]OSN14428.1 hypothetical protein BV341_05465 [Pseudomonas syringae pv. actinidiae]OSN28586.1 hypothetical protein BV343_05368 [Pseudomonas syringae pv. actinidiae]OSN29471.1 hypothetical protein BV342_05486 [Pseudomonas syringae pv. actinidiae]OSN34303.1 hypothetical protein BV344_05378 [Pseudomonas syringae pv. actinidiae]
MDAMSLYWLSMGGAMLMVAVTAFFKVVVASTV